MCTSDRLISCRVGHYRTHRDRGGPPLRWINQACGNNGVDAPAYRCDIKAAPTNLADGGITARGMVHTPNHTVILRIIRHYGGELLAPTGADSGTLRTDGDRDVLRTPTVSTREIS